MNRKDFIRSASLLAGGAVVAPAIGTSNPVTGISNNRFAQQTAQPGTLKKGVGFWMIEDDLPLLDKFKLVRDIGFNGIEFNGPVEVPIREILDARDKTGIELPSLVNKLHWSKPLSDPDPAVRTTIIDSISKTLAETKELGGDTVLVVPGVVNEQVSYETAYKYALDSVKKLIPHVERTGIQIGLENVWNNFIMSPVEAKRFVDEIDHPLIGWYFDIGNVLRYGWPEHWVETLNSRIMKLHVKAFSKKKMDEEGLWKGFEVDLFDGDINWPAVMKALKEVNYKGEWLTVELKAGDRNYLQDVSARLDKIIGLF